MSPQTPKEIALAGESALREIELSVLTQADRVRCERVRRSMRSLDDEQAAAKTRFDDSHALHNAARAEIDAVRAEVAEMRRAISGFEADLPKYGKHIEEILTQRDAAVAEVARLNKVADALQNKASFYLDRSKPFSTNSQADSSIRSDLGRELAVIRARGIR